MNEYAYCEDPTQDAVAKISMWVDGGGVEFNVRDAELLLDTLAAKDREIAALRRALVCIAHTFTEDSHGNMKTLPASEYQNHALAALSASPAPDPALVDRILEADARPPEATFTNSEDMMAYLDAPDPAEAMRAALTAIVMIGSFVEFKSPDRKYGALNITTVGTIARKAIVGWFEQRDAALKGNGERT